MSKPRIVLFAITSLLAWGRLLMVPTCSMAQATGEIDGLDTPFQPIPSLQGFIDPFSSTGQRQITLSAQFRMDPGGKTGQLAVTAQMAASWHTYSLTQRPGGPVRTQIELEPSQEFRLTGPFQPHQPPEIHDYEFFPVPAEEHHGRVTWTAPIEVPHGVDANRLRITGHLRGQVCQEAGSCIPLDQLDTKFVAEFAGVSAPSPSQSNVTSRETEIDLPRFRVPSTHSELTGYVSPPVAAPGGRMTLVLSATPDPGWHVYALRQDGVESVFTNPTVIGVQSPSGWTVSRPVASALPKTEESGFEAEPLLQYHEESVSWSMELTIPSSIPPGTYDLSGLIGYQTCSQTCDLPTGARFAVSVSVSEQTTPGQVPVQFVAAKYKEAAELSEQTPFGLALRSEPASDVVRLDLDQLEAESLAGDASAAVFLLMAFAAGFVLNFMPCVLPVIGLKLIAFVQQSGESRGRIFVLNLWYSVGLISVFMVLASLTVIFGLGWGAQFTSSTFNIVLAAIVFVFALSFLGIWEIPIPGFVGSSKMNDLAAREGPTGAFFKGVLTTVLATPCGGPMLGPALAFFVSQPPVVTFAGFACAGVGMASPYLLIGAFPKLVSFLPKPGLWMDTFKQIMGFVLLGTVVFLLTFLDLPYVVPMVAFMIGLWASFWWIGKTPLTETFGRKLRAWAAASAFATLIGLLAFGWLVDVMESRFHRLVDYEIGRRSVEIDSSVAIRSQTQDDSNELPWQPFSLELLQRLTGEQKTVLVDFTADW